MRKPLNGREKKYENLRALSYKHFILNMTIFYKSTIKYAGTTLKGFMGNLKFGIE